MQKIAVVGIGRWGKNLVRELNKLFIIKSCCNRKNEEDRNWVEQNYPNMCVVSDFSQVVKDKDIGAIVIATPINTHFELAYAALEAGKHVFVEKPIATKVEEAEKLDAKAKEKGLTLLVGHTFLYHPVFQKIRSLLSKPPNYVIFEWSKYGTFQEDIVWNLAVHDIALANELFGQPKKAYVLKKTGIISKADILSFELEYNDGKKASVRINRVSPFKRKTVTIHSDEEFYLWEDNLLYKLNKSTNSYELIFEAKETPLELECKDFFECVTEKKKPYSDGAVGINVVKVAEKIFLDSGNQ